MTRRLRSTAVVGAILVGLAGCGGSADGESGSAEAEKVVEQLKSLDEGEILIQGSEPRVYGPYSLAPGGYVLHFAQPGSGSPAKLVVALESKPGSRSQPYQQVVDSKDRTGTRRVTMSGNLYVHVVTAESEYELRLKPRTS